MTEQHRRVNTRSWEREKAEVQRRGPDKVIALVKLAVVALGLIIRVSQELLNISCVAPLLYINMCECHYNAA